MKKGCGKCDYCEFRSSGVMPKPRAAWGIMVNTSCRMPNNVVDFADQVIWNKHLNSYGIVAGSEKPK